MSRMVLHLTNCTCKGTGWISFPGIGRRAQDCQSDRVIFLPYEIWVELKKPETADEILNERARGLLGLPKKERG